MITRKIGHVDCTACTGYDGGDLVFECSGKSKFADVSSDQLGYNVEPHVPWMATTQQ